MYAFPITTERQGRLCRVSLCSGEMKRHSGGVSMHTCVALVLCCVLLAGGSLVSTAGVVHASSTDRASVSRTTAVARARYGCVHLCLAIICLRVGTHPCMRVRLSCTDLCSTDRVPRCVCIYMCVCVLSMSLSFFLSLSLQQLVTGGNIHARGRY